MYKKILGIMITFGPIPSRRLGKSLGINNIVSRKLCSYNCVYCQVGYSRNQTAERQFCYEPENLIKNVRMHLKKLDEGQTPDYLTFVSQGEPTLDMYLGTEIEELKKFEIPVAVISNSSLINKKEVRDDLMKADWVSLKADSIVEDVWRKLNRPLEELDFNNIKEGMLNFSQEYKGILNTETMLVEGFNDDDGLLEETADFISQMKPSASYLSVPVRPPAEKGVKPVNEIKITTAYEMYKNKGLNTTLLTGFEGTEVGYTGNAYEDILNITAVHPLREDSLAELLKKDHADFEIMESLLNQGLVQKIQYHQHNYYLRKYHK